jgi:enoyl-CoA hydratase
VSEFEVFRIERRDAVAVVWINRPEKKNAMNPTFFRELPQVLDTLGREDGVRAIVLTGAGDAFSAGGDIASCQALSTTTTARRHLRLVFDAFHAIERAELPVIAAVNGVAYGGGSEVAQSTDFIVASDNATFGQPESMIGLAAGGGSPVFLPRALPPGKALQMLMTGDPITADEAYRLGMVNEIYPQSELMDAARRIARKIASNSPTAVQAVKRAVRMGEGQPIEQAIAIMMEAHWRSAVHPDRVEGIGAFNDGRDPDFQDADY